MKLPLRSPSYTCISKRAKTVNISIKMPIRGEVRHLAIDSTGLKVFSEGEWKMKKHGKEKRRVWRKLHLAVDADSQQVIAAKMSRMEKYFLSYYSRPNEKSEQYQGMVLTILDDVMKR